MTAPRRKILIFPAGSEIGLEIHRSLKYSHHCEVLGLSGKSDHASFVYASGTYFEDDRLYVDRPDFVDVFNGYLLRLGIDFVYPTHDTIANFLAGAQPLLAATVITSGPETNRIARSKRATYKFFSAFDFCPRLHSSPYEGLEYPVFLKPDTGQGGKGAFRADDETELAFYLSKYPDLLVMEYLPGEELSVDCFTDFTGRLLFIGPRTRERVQMGISFRSTTVELDKEISAIAHSINERAKPDGAWFFQLKRSDGNRYKLLEFAPRQSSTMGLYRHAGVNFALLSLFNAQKIPVEILLNDYPLQLDRCLDNRYYAGFEYRRVYIDFDETIISGAIVHEKVMAFLYQCRNRGVSIALITKHRYEIETTLHDYGIGVSLFDEIIHLTDDQDKWGFIDPDGAIFIDNYWFDRREVKLRLGIPVFDVDAIECLLR